MCSFKVTSMKSHTLGWRAPLISRICCAALIYICPLARVSVPRSATVLRRSPQNWSITCSEELESKKGDICQPQRLKLPPFIPLHPPPPSVHLHPSHWQPCGHKPCMDDSLTFFFSVAACVSICLCVGVCLCCFVTCTHTHTRIHQGRRGRVKREIDFSKKSRQPSPAERLRCFLHSTQLSQQITDTCWLVFSLVAKDPSGILIAAGVELRDWLYTLTAIVHPRHNKKRSGSPFFFFTFFSYIQSNPVRLNDKKLTFH